jgi:predicted acetyltransferase
VATFDLERVPATDARLARLLQLYVHEWSARLPIWPGEDGLFRYEELRDWQDEHAHEAWLVIDGERRVPAGFALLWRDASACWQVKEMFVIASARRHRVGQRVAHALFARHPGRWTLTVRPENPDALAFWRRTVPASAIEAREPGADGVVRTRFRFESE